MCTTKKSPTKIERRHCGRPEDLYRQIGLWGAESFLGKVGADRVLKTGWRANQFAQGHRSLRPDTLSKRKEKHEGAV